MALYFDNVEVLGLSYIPQYLGDLARYNTEKRVTIRGQVTNLTNFSGISGIWSGMQTISQNTDYDQIILNGLDFGRGKITNTSFTEGIDVRLKQYTTEIVCYESGNLFNIVNGTYSGVAIPEPTFLDSLNESLNYTKGENGQSTYQHKISVAYRSGFNASGTQISLAQQCASGLFIANNFTGLLGLYNHNYRKTNDEVYNYITNECNFTKTYNFFREDGNYSIDYKHISEINTDGIVNVTEEGQIHRIIGTAMAGTYSALDSVLSSSYSRCQAINAAYHAGPVLIVTPIVRAATVNTFASQIDYSITFTNDPKINNSYSWQYTNTLDKNQEGVTIVSENGSIVGFGRVSSTKFENAEIGYDIAKPGALGRIQTLYNTYLPTAGDLNPISTNLSLNRYNGTIEYGLTCSDDKTLRIGEITKIEVLEDISNPVHLSTSYDILGEKEIVQDSRNASVGVQTTTVNLWGNRNQPLQTWIDQAKSQVDQPGGDDVFLADANYSLDPFESKFTLTVTHHFHGSKSFKSSIIDL